MSKAKEKINFVEWAGKIASVAGLLTLLAYSSGYVKLFVMYKIFHCQWVLSYHSFQEIAFAGVADLMVCMGVGLPFFFFNKDAREIDTHGLRIVYLVATGVALMVLTASFVGINVSYLATDFIFLMLGYGAFGVFAAAVSKNSEEKKSYKYMAILFPLYLFWSGSTAYYIYGSKNLHQLIGEGRYEFVSSGDGQKGILVSAVGGRYLIRLCNIESEFKLVSRSDEWTVRPWKEGQCDM